jgi:hypothetical protein
MPQIAESAGNAKTTYSRGEDVLNSTPLEAYLSGLRRLILRSNFAAKWRAALGDGMPTPRRKSLRPLAMVVRPARKTREKRR